jgi:hypothetical protein
MKITLRPLINPIAKALLSSRKPKQVIPNKKKYNRKRDKRKEVNEAIS